MRKIGLSLPGHVVPQIPTAPRRSAAIELSERVSESYNHPEGAAVAQSNLWQMRDFYLAWPILQTASGESRPAKPVLGNTPKAQTLSGLSGEHHETPLQRFPLPWSHYVRLLAVKGRAAQAFYETEALRGGWSVRQLDRQIATQFYERTALSRNKAALIKRAQRSIPEDQLTAEEEIKDPMVLEFLGLKDEYSESALEEALIHRLEQFLLELVH